MGDALFIRPGFTLLPLLRNASTHLLPFLERVELDLDDLHYSLLFYDRTDIHGHRRLDYSKWLRSPSLCCSCEAPRSSIINRDRSVWIRDASPRLYSRATRKCIRRRSSSYSPTRYRD